MRKITAVILAVVKFDEIMKFYDRQKELETLENVRNTAFNVNSQMTVVTGRRRIGKTKLILKSCENTPTVYWFVSRTNETELCRQFADIIRQSLDVFVPDGISSFRDVFQMCMEIGKSRKYNLIIDEFQELYQINASIFSYMQNIWDSMKDLTNVNLIVSGSVYTMMHKIFQDSKEPLYGRANCIMRVKPFSVDVMKQILGDYNPHYTNDDLLALYAFTGGVPKYIELLMDRESVSVRKMISQMTEENSIFIEEGNVMLIQEFGKKYGIYYSVLSAIASGVNEPSRISQVTGLNTLGGTLLRLEEDYDVIAKKRPIFAKEASQTVRYEIKDHFLRFWFRYIVRNQNLVQTGHYERLREVVANDYETYSGKELEDYFKDKIMQIEPVESIGSWWETSRKANKTNEQNEVDIVATYYNEKKVLIAEVKRQRKSFKPEKFQEKVEKLRTRLFYDYTIETKCLTLDDM